jgi:hypothetical protein
MQFRSVTWCCVAWHRREKKRSRRWRSKPERNVGAHFEATRFFTYGPQSNFAAAREIVRRPKTAGSRDSSSVRSSQSRIAVNAWFQALCNQRRDGGALR